jgi:hypothetical protein
MRCLSASERPPLIDGVNAVLGARRIRKSTDRSEIMKYRNTARATLLGATAAALLGMTAGVAVADNATPNTTTQPSQQQTGVTTPTQQPSATNAPASATTVEPTKSYPTRIWTRRAERGTRTAPR